MRLTAASATGGKARSRGYMLALLAVILAFNFADRIALGLVLQDIKREFVLSDTQLGLLTGLAFALFYSVMGVPIARWADRGNRVVIITLSLALWGIAVVMSGMARSYIELLAIRVVVAVGEAGCLPIAHSLIADYFDRAERPRATGRFLLGGPLATFIGYFFSGWLNELHGWRSMFVTLGAASVILAPLAFLTLSEPRTDRPKEAAGEAAPAPGLKAVCTTLASNATFRNLLFAYSLMSFFASGIGKWQATFLIRSFGMTSGELGTWLTLTYSIGGVLGLHVGGRLATRYAARNEALQLRSMAFVMACFVIIEALIYQAPNKYVAFTFMALATISGAATSAPLFATIQSLVPERMRALAIALIMLIANLVGMGLAPLAVGVLSDVLATSAGVESLRYALLAMCPGYLWVGWHILRASRTVARDLDAVR